MGVNNYKNKEIFYSLSIRVNIFLLRKICISIGDEE